MSSFLTKQIQLFPEQANVYEGFLNLHKKKLWYQLYLDLLKNLKENNHFKGDVAKDLFYNFIADIGFLFEPFKFAFVSYLIAESQNNVDDSIDILKKSVHIIFSPSDLNFNDKTEKSEGYIYTILNLTLFYIKKDEILKAKHFLDEAKEYLFNSNKDQKGIISAANYSKYYQAYAQLMKYLGQEEEFYAAGLLLLGFTSLSSLPQEQRDNLCLDLVFSALHGPKNFNFGPLLTNNSCNSTDNVLTSLSVSLPQFAYLHDLVNALHLGQIQTVRSILHNQHIKMLKESPLIKNSTVIKNINDIIMTIEKKAVILALVELVFNKSSHDRLLSFEEIAHSCDIKEDEVEEMIMRAISLDLIKAKVDEINRTIQVTWIKPRVLDNNQIKSMLSQISAWTNKVEKVLVTLDEDTVDLF